MTLRKEPISELHFIKSMEFVPGKNLGEDDMEKVSGKINGLVDVVTVPENPLGSPGIDPVLSLYALSTKMDFVGMPHLTPRDKNSLHLRSQAITSLKLGIRNFFVIYGDPISAKVNSREVRELDVLGTMRTIRDSKNEFNGSSGTIRLSIGGATNPSRDGETENLLRKKEAGADFFITQGIYDPESMQKEWIREKNFRIIAGFIPVKRKSQISQFESMGIKFSPDSKRRLENADDVEAESIRIIEEIFDQVKGGVDGIHIMPMGKTDIAKTILESI